MRENTSNMVRQPPASILLFSIFIVLVGQCKNQYKQYTLWTWLIHCTLTVDSVTHYWISKESSELWRDLTYRQHQGRVEFSRLRLILACIFDRHRLLFTRWVWGFPKIINCILVVIRQTKETIDLFINYIRRNRHWHLRYTYNMGFHDWKFISYIN